jgi:hypothetical protein
LEEKYFSAFFHRKTGICFRDWLAGRRVGRAIEILTQRDDTITNVAASVGFQDLGTFERSFKRLTGLTPRDFKRSVAPRAVAQAAPAIASALPLMQTAEALAEPMPGGTLAAAGALPLYASAARTLAPRGTGLLDLQYLPAGPFFMATPPGARAPTLVPP